MTDWTRRDRRGRTSPTRNTRTAPTTNTGSRSNVMSLALPVRALLHACVPERLGQLRAPREAVDEFLHVTRTQRDRPAPRSPARRVRETHETLALRAFEQLDDRGEPLVARALLDAQLLDERRRAPRSSRLRCHERQPSVESVTCPSQLRDRSRTEPGHLGVEQREERLGVVDRVLRWVHARLREPSLRELDCAPRGRLRRRPGAPAARQG